MHGFPQPENQFSLENSQNSAIGADQSPSTGTVGAAGDPNGKPALAQTELDTALQLLVERAQYITGATGTALALPQGEEMVCRASAGSSAPAVGACLQVRSGLTGESIVRRQLLRCDNAETDARVNLEACRALGIASMVVLPLMRRNGEVCGLFELFSDHPYAFEERDLIALERMADLTMTALDLAEQREPAPAARPEIPPARPVISQEGADSPVESVTARTEQEAPATPIQPEFKISDQPVPPVEPPKASSPEVSKPAPSPVPEAMLRVQKCSSCGFPVSEGRTLCLDCEKKAEERDKNKEKPQSKIPTPQQDAPLAESESESESKIRSLFEASKPLPEEFVPAFLANSAPPQTSWLDWPVQHVNLLAIIVLVLGVLLAVVVFR